MHIHYVTIFPEIFGSFVSTSLIAKSQDKQLITYSCHDIRSYTTDKHHTVDDVTYGVGQGMLLMAQPIIDCLRDIIGSIAEDESFQIIQPSPSEIVFDQKKAHEYAPCDHLIFVCGRYEGIDHRVQLWCEREYPDRYQKISLGRYVTLGGECVSMVMTEAIVRLIPGVIKEEVSWQDESYSMQYGMSNIEYPQYTRPQDVEGFGVPDVLLSGHHLKIQERKDEMMG